MKLFLLVLIILLTAFIVKPHFSPACKEIHTGTFYFYPKNSTKKYTLVRTANFQYETRAGSPDTTTYKIRWKTGCTYAAKRLVKGTYLPDNTIPEIHINVLTVTAGYYIMQASADSTFQKLVLTDTIWRKEKK